MQSQGIFDDLIHIKYHHISSLYPYYEDSPPLTWGMSEDCYTFILRFKEMEKPVAMQTLTDVKAGKNATPIIDHYNKHLAPFYYKIITSWQRIAFWSIMALAAFLRLYQFPNTPAGLWVDELTEGYDAYALLLHGTDRWGNPFPIYFPSWGSGQNVLQAYLTIPFIKLFGLNAFSIRILPDLLGILAVYLLYLTAKKIYGTNTALLAAFLLATLPWYVMVSRWSLESNLLPFFLLLSVFTLLYCYDSPHRRRWIPISLLPLALCFYAYGIAIVIVPTFLALFIVCNYKTILKVKASFLISILLFLLISTPFFLFVLENYVLHRALPFLAHLPITIPYLPSSRLSQVNNNLSHRAILLDNLRFLIGGYNDGKLSNSISWISPLGWLVPPFAALGVYFSLKRQTLSRNLFVFWLVAVLPTFVLFFFIINRANALFIPLFPLSAYGIVSLLENVQPIRSQVFVTAILVGSLFFPNIIFYRYYFTTYDKDNAWTFNADFDQVMAHALSLAHPDENLYIFNNDGWDNYMATLFYLRLDPQDFYTHANIQIIDGIYWVRSYRRYYFGPGTSPAALSNVTSYVAILKANRQVSCQRTEILYQDTRWPGGPWVVERCYPAHVSQASQASSIHNTSPVLIGRGTYYRANLN